jgi:hypothetical protein
MRAGRWCLVLYVGGDNGCWDLIVVVDDGKHLLGQYGHCRESREVIVWVLTCLLLFDPVVDFDFIDRYEHSCSVAREIIDGGIVYGDINTFIVAGLENFDNVVIVWLLGFEVDAGEFGRELGVALKFLDEALFILQVIIIPVKELFLAIWKCEGMFDVLLHVTLTPIINHLDNPIWHG